MKSPRRVKVEWIDIVRSTSAWSTHQELDEIKPSLCKSVGWLVKENDDFIVLATNIGDDWEDEDVGILVAIPRCVISSVNDLIELAPQQPRPKGEWTGDKEDRCKVCGREFCDANHDYDRYNYSDTDLE